MLKILWERIIIFEKLSTETDGLRTAALPDTRPALLKIRNRRPGRLNNKHMPEL